MYILGYFNLWFQRQKHIFKYLKPIFCFDSFAHFDKSHIRIWICVKLSQRSYNTVILNQLEAMSENFKTSCERFAKFASLTWYENLLQKLISSKEIESHILIQPKLSSLLCKIITTFPYSLSRHKKRLKFMKIRGPKIYTIFRLTIHTKSIMKAHFGRIFFSPGN